METIRNYNVTRRLFPAYAFSFAIGIMAIAAQALQPGFALQGLDLIGSFFIYALLSQFVHLSWTHLLLNLTGLAMVCWGFNLHRTAGELLWIQASSLIWVAFYLAAIEPLDWYCGLSGALHFQFASCLLLSFYRSPRTFSRNWPLWVMAAGLLIKLALEWNSGHNTDILVGGPIAYEAHRGGAIGGALMGLLMLLPGRGSFSRG